MIFNNVELYNVSEVYPLEGGGVGWRRVPEWVENELSDGGKNMNRSCTGVELRFVLRGEQAIIRMAGITQTYGATNVFHVYRGGIQGGWDDHEADKYVGPEVHDFIIRRSGNMETLQRYAKIKRDPFDPEVIRVIFDRGHYRFVEVIGDVEPPTKRMTPEKTILFYGSSITHGSNSIDASHTFAAQVGARLGCDVRNLGYAGSCAMEPAMAKYIAEEGKAGRFDAAVLELGINVIGWPEDLIRTRVENILREVAGANPEKPIVVISPFYAGEDFYGRPRLANWRKIIKEIVEMLNFPNVTYVNGLDLLGSPALLSADEVHPNIDGVAAIADGLAAILKKKM